MYRVLDRVNFPDDMRGFSVDELRDLAQDIRGYMIETLSKTGGHLGAGLGVVELSIALHYVFKTPIDKVIWDIGHQAYPHKILTGRKDLLPTIRQAGGISGFCSIFESEYDVFGAGHSSTSISAALGLAKGRDLKGERHDVVAVIGDSSITGGMAYEGLNNASDLGSKVIIILNDNDMSIAPAVGAMRNYLVRLIGSSRYIRARGRIKSMLPDFASRFMKKAESAVKDMIIGGNIFESMGFYYIGPIDGHEIEDVIEVLKTAKESDMAKPILIHVRTEKGRGYEPAKHAQDKLHGVVKFDIATGKQEKCRNLTYTDVFSRTLIHLARGDERVVAITAGMPNGTGLDKFGGQFPSRMFDVAIAEQHAVTFSGGLAMCGYKPYCVIYSTFLQRAYDQIIHDICIQKLPVRFAIDRAGYVGADGATHAGSFDIAFLSILPNIIVMAPSCEIELISMMKAANEINDMPCAFRYPRGLTCLEEMPDIEGINAAEIGKMRDIYVHEGDVVIISYGACLGEVKLAYEELKNVHGILVSVIDGRFAKPLDEARLKALGGRKIITVEEGSVCGFGGIVADFMSRNNLGARVVSLHMSDEFLAHDTISNMKAKSGIDKDGIVSFVLGI
ncbi:1-deoxy-D-xylulose-5-phosphate synthase [Candidatus Deianiraea vastatrix]|uniref:1-deoxy-D-xylulose-5-phosphate synthase n=1 Tax=Candidatus Deianiraea vastatrix TaxID=2163644 RepID=A0A5B8XEA3_9RICK|nr:1-deoxy-D-xylulose-5-phosphate synthase [Candidatus Deianiraea vastatrix]QED23642.1 1-deoxy-D-xylulose-5-phosphate synthase [Candidatus Deianiraea vastatrix]